MRAVAVALRKAASGHPSEVGVFAVTVTSTAEAKCASPCAALRSQPQINTQAANTHKIEMGSSAATARFS
jgi:hypothetical protein